MYSVIVTFDYLSTRLRTALIVSEDSFASMMLYKTTNNGNSDEPQDEVAGVETRGAHNPV